MNGKTIFALIAAFGVGAVSYYSRMGGGAPDLDISIRTNQVGNFEGVLTSREEGTISLRSLIVNGRDDSPECVLVGSPNTNNPDFVAGLRRSDNTYWDDHPIPVHRLRLGDRVEFTAWRGCGDLTTIAVELERGRHVFRID